MRRGFFGRKIPLMFAVKAVCRIPLTDCGTRDRVGKERLVAAIFEGFISSLLPLLLNILLSLLFGGAV